MLAFEQLSVQSCQRNPAAIHLHLRINLSRHHFLEKEPAHMQIALSLDRQQGRAAFRLLRTEEPVPRTFGGMRREPFQQIGGRKLVGGKVKMKRATLQESNRRGNVRTRVRTPVLGKAGQSIGRALTRYCYSASPIGISRARGNLLQRYRLRSESHSRRINLNRSIQ